MRIDKFIVYLDGPEPRLLMVSCRVGGVPGGSRGVPKAIGVYRPKSPERTGEWVHERDATREELDEVLRLLPQLFEQCWNK